MKYFDNFINEYFSYNTVLGDSLNGWCLLLIKDHRADRLQHWISKDARVMRNL